MADAAEGRAGQGGEVEHRVYVSRRLPDQVPVSNVPDDDFEPPFRGDLHRWTEAMGSVLQIPQRARGEIVQDTDGRSAVEQTIDEMRPQEAGTACDEDRTHGRSQRLMMEDRLPRKVLIALRVSTTRGARSAITA